MESRNRKGNQLPKGARIIFGIFMILVYLGMGTLFLMGYFKQILPEMIGNIVGVLLAIYGLWRGYRLFKGMN